MQKQHPVEAGKNGRAYGAPVPRGSGARRHGLSAASLGISWLLLAGCGPAPTPRAPDLSLADDTTLFAPPGTTVVRSAQPDAVVAVVNGIEIRHRELVAEIALVKTRLQRSQAPERVSQLHEQSVEAAMESAVTKALLRSAMDEAGIEVSEAELEQAFSQLDRVLPEGVTLEQFMEQNGLSVEELRTRTAAEIRFRKLVDRQLSDVPPPTDEEVNAYYEAHKSIFQLPERVRLRRILIAMDAGDEAAEREAKRERAAALHEELLAGAAFDQLARMHSDGARAEQGGDLGFLARTQMDPTLADAAFALDLNAPSDVVETSYGYHIIEVTAREEARAVEFEEAHERLSAEMLEARRRSALQEYIAQLKAEATIEIPDPPRPGAQ